MEKYRIVPARRAYRVEAVEQDGSISLIDTCRTEEAAMSRLRDLQARAEAGERRAGARDWRG
jgi:hypothetical protein